MILQGLRHQSGRSLFTVGNAVPKKVTTRRFIHFIPGGRCVPLRATFTHDLYKRTNLLAALSVRHNSTILDTTDTLPSLPDPPVPVSDVAQTIIQYHANGDPTFSSIGLGGYGPVGLLQYFLEALHVHADLSWCGSIIAASVILKLLTVPFYIKAQRLQANTRNHSSQLQTLQQRVMEEQSSGNIMEATILMKEQQQYMKKYNLSPFKPLALSFIQTGVSLCTFFALRGILTSDLDSLRFGGYWWFPDLTISDPMYLLPVAAVVSVALIAETMMGSGANQPPYMKYTMRALPLISLPIMVQFASGLQLFWLSTNVLTVMQMAILKIPQLQKMFNIPMQSEAQQGEFNMMDNIKKWAESNQLKKDRKGRVYKDHLLLAARQPYVKTFKYNPKTQTSSMFNSEKVKMK